MLTTPENPGIPASSEVRFIAEACAVRPRTWASYTTESRAAIAGRVPVLVVLASATDLGAHGPGSKLRRGAPWEVSARRRRGLVVRQLAGVRIREHLVRVVAVAAGVDVAGEPRRRTRGPARRERPVRPPRAERVQRLARHRRDLGAPGPVAAPGHRVVELRARAGRLRDGQGQR